MHCGIYARRINVLSATNWWHTLWMGFFFSKRPTNWILHVVHKTICDNHKNSMLICALPSQEESTWKREREKTAHMKGTKHHNWINLTLFSAMTWTDRVWANAMPHNSIRYVWFRNRKKFTCKIDITISLELPHTYIHHTVRVRINETHMNVNHHNVIGTMITKAAISTRICRSIRFTAMWRVHSKNHFFHGK